MCLGGAHKPTDVSTFKTNVLLNGRPSLFEPCTNNMKIKDTFSAPKQEGCTASLLALFHCMVRHGTVRYGSLLGGFPLGTVPGT